jgi:hypothetical protein
VLQNFDQEPFWKWNRDSSSVNRITRLRAGRPGFNSRQEQGFSLFAIDSRPVLGPSQPPINAYRAVFPPGINGPGPEADRSPPCSV